MGWSGRAPTPPASEAGRGCQRRGARYVRQTQLCNRCDRHRYRQELVSRRGPRSAWGIVLRQKWSRRQVEARLANLPPCLIGMEDCVGAHHLSRRLQMLGHDARLMPAKYVRPYSKGQKNDFRDAEAITETVQRPTMKSRQRLPNSSICRRSTACVSGWSVSAPASSIRSAPSCWTVASPCGKACASCAQSCRAFSLRPAMLCRPACCASSRTWPVIGAGSMSASKLYPARSKRWRGRISTASG